jgi:hypothetical protein
MGWNLSVAGLSAEGFSSILDTDKECLWHLDVMLDHAQQFTSRFTRHWARTQTSANTDDRGTTSQGHCGHGRAVIGEIKLIWGRGEGGCTILSTYYFQEKQGPYYVGSDLSNSHHKCLNNPLHKAQHSSKYTFQQTGPSKHTSDIYVNTLAVASNGALI